MFKCENNVFVSMSIRKYCLIVTDVLHLLSNQSPQPLLVVQSTIILLALHHVSPAHKLLLLNSLSSSLSLMCSSPLSGCSYFFICLLFLPYLLSSFYSYSITFLKCSLFCLLAQFNKQSSSMRKSLQCSMGLGNHSLHTENTTGFESFSLVMIYVLQEL